MSLQKFLLFFFFFTVLVSCNEKTVEKSNKETIQVPVKAVQKIEIKKVVKSWDSLKNNNVEAFFTEYLKKNKDTKVRITTKFGTIDLRLYNNTPIHRANFIFLTKIGYFNTTVFYRVAKNFVIQGGNSDDMYTMEQRKKYGNYLMKPEFRKNRTHKYGALAAARSYEKNPDQLSSPFEFYIVQSKHGAHHLDSVHTVFGEVIRGYSTMEKISKVEVDRDEWPKIDIKMKVEILD